MKDWAKIRAGLDELFGVDREELKNAINKESKEFRAWRDKMRKKVEDAFRKLVENLDLDQLLELIALLKEEIEKRTK